MVLIACLVALSGILLLTVGVLLFDGWRSRSVADELAAEAAEPRPRVVNLAPPRATSPPETPLTRKPRPKPRAQAVRGAKPNTVRDRQLVGQPRPDLRSRKALIAATSTAASARRAEQKKAQ